jgi:hypothetical protein
MNSLTRKIVTSLKRRKTSARVVVKYTTPEYRMQNPSVRIAETFGMPQKNTASKSAN